jgi:hypothetical protein
MPDPLEEGKRRAAAQLDQVIGGEHGRWKSGRSRPAHGADGALLPQVSASQPAAPEQAYRLPAHKRAQAVGVGTMPDPTEPLGQEPVSVPATATGATATGATSAGFTALLAVAGGAVALGAVALGAVAIGRLVIRRAVIRQLRVDELEIAHLRVGRLEMLEPES